MRNRFVVAAIAVLFSGVALAAPAGPGPLVMTRADYEQRVEAAWLGQIIGVLMTLPYEHQVSSVLPLSAFPKPYTSAIVDDDGDRPSGRSTCDSNSCV